MLRCFRRSFRAALLALLAVVLSMAIPSLAAPSSGPSGFGVPGFNVDLLNRTQPERGLSVGKYELAKVNILGVPAISVSSSVLNSDGGSPAARQRAAVIEGNLRLLYDPSQLCSQGERLSEWLLDSVLGGETNVCTAGLGPGMALSDRPVRLEIVSDGKGNQTLEALLADRQRAFPLLSVTEADAEINGVTTEQLAKRWRTILESRINHARSTLRPQQLALRWRITLVVELLLLGLIAVSLLAWSRLRRKVSRLQRQRFKEEHRPRSFEVRLHLTHTITRVLMVWVLFLLVMMVGLGVMAVPGQIPLALELLLQPSFALIKVGVVTMVGLLGRALSTFLLHQWADNVDVMAQERARRDQRYRSLLRVIHRLIDVSCLLVVGLWVLLDVPGVRTASISILLAGGALLGALAFVFQGLLRDFVAGMLVLIEDRYAIGDWIEIDGVEGEVVDVGLFSTQIRCLDQRVDTLDNSTIRQLRNHTKLRSGSLVTFVVSHRQSSIDQAIALIREEIDRFVNDSDWNHRLLGEPVLRGVRRITPLGTHLEVLLITKSGGQWVS
ncbi:mechanosensitive ion channel family protein [Synechococcus sp. BMK-MC-1]|uniref:mechanosensitive ion channel family protein n=1 Tax=Synechococcus sp. BMK-MC-1 TaxID=1442551 RepID=UPI0018621C6E|nr:mechanosensitive ion channel domain-containing protein [Synechococcus sp. BMK-MC-1]QNI68020.1 small-conductance mechanosensitive ion channel/ MscS family [Synechococcus sp. BMK-MC-1]